MMPARDGRRPATSSCPKAGRSRYSYHADQTPDSEGSVGCGPTDPSRCAGKSSIVDSQRFTAAPPAMICACQQCFASMRRCGRTLPSSSTASSAGPNYWPSGCPQVKPAWTSTTDGGGPCFRASTHRSPARSAPPPAPGLRCSTRAPAQRPVIAPPCGWVDFSTRRLIQCTCPSLRPAGCCASRAFAFTSADLWTTHVKRSCTQVQVRRASAWRVHCLTNVNTKPPDNARISC